MRRNNMKTYNRQTKSWEDPADAVLSLKKKETCRGKRPHEYQLVLPNYVRTTHDFTSDDVLSYYALEDKLTEQTIEIFEEMRQLGASAGKPFMHYYRYFECQVCKKKEMEVIEFTK